MKEFMLSRIEKDKAFVQFIDEELNSLPVLDFDIYDSFVSSS